MNLNLDEEQQFLLTLLCALAVLVLVCLLAYQ